MVKYQYVMFDTGSSLFTLNATKKDALETADPKIPPLSLIIRTKFLVYCSGRCNQGPMPISRSPSAKQLRKNIVDYT